MASLKFKDPSPYLTRNTTAPPEDYLMKIYDDHLFTVGESKASKIVVALFGLGRAGTIHLTNLVNNNRVTLAYVVDDDASKHDKVRKHWGESLKNTKFLTSKDAKQIFADSTVKMVVVATPTFTHEGFVKNALTNNKAVFCEKPIAESTKTSVELYQLAEKMKLPLLSAFNRRFDPAYSSVRDKVHKGVVGHVQMIKVCSRDSPLPTVDYLKHSGGIFHDCAVHDIDIMCWVLGELPTRVHTMATSHVPEIAAIDDFDSVAMTLKFPSGTIGTIDLSRNSNYGYDQRLEVFGARGMVRADNEQPIHSITEQTGLTGITSAPIWYSFPSRYAKGYYNELEHFLDVVEGKATLSVKGYETLAVSKIASALEESARSGKEVEIKWTKQELGA